MPYPTGVEKVECDILIIGGGMSGCGAAYEAKYWGRKLKVVLVEKAATERSGAVAAGLSAINLYLGMRWGENTPEDYVRYVRNDLMGIVREDLIYDVARHVDSTVHLFEEWGLPIYKDPKTGRYLREGRWQILISGESYKPIVAEAAKKSVDALYERVFITHLLPDKNNPRRVAGAIGFGVRDGKLYIFLAKAVIMAAGGAVHIFRPRSHGEGMGRTWYPPWDSGSAYAMMIMMGAEMTQMENRFVPMRFKDGYGPVGAYFLFLKCKATNALGEDYFARGVEKLKQMKDKFGPYVEATPLPTCLRNHIMLEELREGRGPIFMRHDLAIKEVQDPKERAAKERWCWEDFLDMTPSQALLWACLNLDPAEKPSELMVAEPYIMGSHAGCAGAWVSGPEDIAPPEYQWGYNRMTTIEGLFACGDAVGASAHKFSSGSFTEG
ncbi:MAG: adenylyl-sulfate reductase subunit alpha, partial [Crenarchaeota archaeon]|nr:adenylyl-sulfate reductase subunit alpha [Thermoproteota archaeon]